MTTSRPDEKLGKGLGKWKIFYYLTGLLGLVLIVFGIHIFRATVVNVIIPISITLAVGLCAFFFNRSHYRKTYSTNGTLLPLIQNIVSWGFISGYFFFATNYYLADKKVKNLEFEIKSKSSMTGSKGRRDERKPLVTIDYFGFRKELVFTYEDTKKVENASKVILTVKKGFLGFDILDNYDTVDNSK